MRLELVGDTHGGPASISPKSTYEFRNLNMQVDKWIARLLTCIVRVGRWRRARERATIFQYWTHGTTPCLAR